MKLRFSLVLFIAVVTTLAFDAAAQSSKAESKSAQSAEELRLQLLEVEARESELQVRARQLDEDLKPENIERYFAGVGSTRPEALREMRRRQLSSERQHVQAQLKLLGTSRERLESVISFAETQAYQESAEVTGAPQQMLRGHFGFRPRAVALMLAGLAVSLGTVFVIGAMVRKANLA